MIEYIEGSRDEYKAKSEELIASLNTAGTRIEELTIDCAQYKKERWDVEVSMRRRQTELEDQIFLLQQTLVMIAKS